MNEDQSVNSCITDEEVRGRAPLAIPTERGQNEPLEGIDKRLSVAVDLLIAEVLRLRAAVATPSHRSGLHERIKEVCQAAAPIVASAAKGTESGAYHLNHHVADLCALLCRELGGFREALAQRGVQVTIDPPSQPNKAA